MLVAEERVDVFGSRCIGTDDRVGLNCLAFVFDGLEGFRMNMALSVLAKTWRQFSRAEGLVMGMMMRGRELGKV